MTAQETNKILAILTEAYPMFLKGRSAEVTASLWQRLLEDVSYEQAEKALMTCIATDTTGFPPTIGQIRSMIGQYEQPRELEDFQAWNLVREAASNSIYNSKEEYAKLPREVQEIVGSPNQLREWAMMVPEEFETVVHSNFRRSFNARKESRLKYAVLPQELRKSLGDGMEENQPYLAQTELVPMGSVFEKLNGINGGNDNENHQS